MKHHQTFVVAVLVLGAAQVLKLSAQEQAPVFADIAPCMAITDTSARYACYDRLEAAVRAAQPATAAETAGVAPEDRAGAVSLPTEAEAQGSVDKGVPGPANAEAVTVENFGETTAGQAQIIADGAGNQELHDTIAGLQEREPGRWLITLESGQVWYQTNSGRIRLRKGMEVRIYPSPLGGSFRLAGTDSTTGFVQVQRVE